MSNPVCPKTGAPMQRGVRPMTLEYKGACATFDMPGWYCEESDESIHTGEDMKMSDRALNRLKAATEGLPLPEEIKRIRTKLGLTQEEAGELIGGGPRAFQKYEAGDCCQAGVLAAPWRCSIATLRGFRSFICGRISSLRKSRRAVIMLGTKRGSAILFTGKES